MKRTFFILAMVIALVPEANPQARTKRPESQKRPTAQPSVNAASKNVVTVQSNGSVAGAFSVNGKPVNLKYVFAQRQPSTVPGSGGALELFVTNQPVPEAILKTITANEKRLFHLLDDYFKGTSITGIYFWIGKVPREDNKVNYFQTLIAPESYRLDDLPEFSSFTMRKGKLHAKAANKGEQDGIKWSYALDVNVTLESLPSPTGLPDTVVAGSPIGLPPDEGKANGTIEKKGGKTIKLSIAYAWREKRFFDEPDETIYVLVTESPVAKEKALFADLSKMRELGQQGKLRGVMIELDSSGVCRDGTVFLEASSFGDFRGRPTVTAFRIESGRVKGRAEYKSDDSQTYAVIFDAPLKN